MADRVYIDVCPHCGAERLYDPWVLAHWDILLKGNCAQCKKDYWIRSGAAYKTLDEANND